MKGAGLQGSDPFGHELAATVDEARFLGAVLQRATRDLVVVGFVGLSKIRGVRVRDGALCAHPVERRAGVETAGKRDADTLAGRKTLKNVAHVSPRFSHSSCRVSLLNLGNAFRTSVPRAPS